MRSHHSPFPAELRSGFTGLNYFEPDPAYVVDARLEAAEAQTLDVPRTDGDVVQYECVGTLRFTLPTGAARLALYRTGDDHWLPVRDATNGLTTYPAGRYLDPDDPTFLDFNLLYNPFCAYNEAYACPLVPTENHLPVALSVGERYFEDP